VWSKAGASEYDRGMTRRLLLLACMALLAGSAAAEGSRLVRVSVEFHRTDATSRDAVGAGGGVIVTERGGARSRIRGGAESTTTRSRSRRGVFTLVQDGGEARLVVATQVPYAQVAFYRDYATGRGHVASGVVFRDVGTALHVRAHVLPDGRIRVRLTPSISWLAGDGAGTIDFTEAATDLIVPPGRPVVLVGSTTGTDAVTREILGLGQERTATDLTVVLTASVQR
jgi:hypothetical protein